MQTCPRCGTDQEDGARYCRFCGYALKKKSVLRIAVPIIVVAIVLVGVGIGLFSGESSENLSGQNQNTQSTVQQAEWEMQEEESEPVESESVYQIIYGNYTWQEAFSRCRILGGSLVTFETEEEYQKVLSQLDTDKIYYIGAGRAENSTSYYWVNPDLTLSDQSLDGSVHWMDGEPSLSEGNIGEYYVNLFYLKMEGRWVWNDIPNDTIAVAPNYRDRIGYICEIQKTGGIE